MNACARARERNFPSKRMGLHMKKLLKKGLFWRIKHKDWGSYYYNNQFFNQAVCTDRFLMVNRLRNHQLLAKLHLNIPIKERQDTQQDSKERNNFTLKITIHYNLKLPWCIRVTFKLVILSNLQANKLIVQFSKPNMRLKCCPQGIPSLNLFKVKINSLLTHHHQLNSLTILPFSSKSQQQNSNNEFNQVLR